VGEHRNGECLNVVGQDEVAGVERSDGLARPEQVERRAG